MLQIITGKFFHSEERYKYDCYYPIYSNYSWVDDIDCSIAILSPTSLDRSDYVLRYQNQIERTPDSVIVRIGDEEIVNQFKDICIFGLQAMFDTEKGNIDRLCNQRSPVLNEDAEILPRYFDKYVHGNLQEVEDFKKLVANILGLPRTKYNVIKRCLSAFSGSLNTVSYNLDLAYSMLIYCLETLCQNFDGYEPKWEDYEGSKSLDLIINDLEPRKADFIRKEILKDKNLKSQKRFIDFISKYTKDGFFIKINVSTKNDPQFTVIRKSEFKAALKNAYSLRSSYAHELSPVLPLLKVRFIKGDIYRHDCTSLFTYSGLVRLTRHVLYNYIEEQEMAESEECDWRAELPNVHMMKLAPSYWVSRVAGFHASHAKLKLSGFLSELAQFYIKGLSITDCSQLMDLYESLINGQQIKKEYLIPIAVHYSLYNSLVPEEYRSKNQDIFFKCVDKNGYHRECCIENLLFYSLTNQTWTWEADECKKQYEKYLTQKNRRIKKRKAKTETCLEIPPIFEIFLVISISQKYLEESRFDDYNELMNFAFLDSSNYPTIQNLIFEKSQLRENITLNSFIESFSN